MQTMGGRSGMRRSPDVSPVGSPTTVRGSLMAAANKKADASSTQKESVSCQVEKKQSAGERQKCATGEYSANAERSVKVPIHGKQQSIPRPWGASRKPVALKPRVQLAAPEPYPPDAWHRKITALTEVVRPTRYSTSRLAAFERVCWLRPHLVPIRRGRATQAGGRRGRLNGPNRIAD